MSQRVVFECTRLQGTDKKGVVTQNKDGTYTQVVGGLNVHNFHGDYYPYEEAKKLFTDNSDFMRQVNRGVVRGELGHPHIGFNGESRDPQKVAQFSARLMFIDPKMICCTHRRIWLDFESVLGNDGRPIIAIMSDVFPSGPYAATLRGYLENPMEQSTFSVRAFADLKPMPNGRTIRQLTKIVTFDWENEPGIEYAEKLRPTSPSLESLNSQFTDMRYTAGFSVGVTPEILRAELNKVGNGAVMESIHGGLDTDSLVQSVFINHDSIRKERKNITNW